MLNTLKPDTKRKKNKLVGRGSKRGKTSGRGTKGQKARAGHRIRPELRDAIKKLPKLRGRGKNVNKAYGVVSETINLNVLNVRFEKGATISPTVLFEKGLVRRVKGNLPRIKILGTGEIDKALNFYDCTVSAAAKAKIEKIGGTVNG